MFLDRKYWPSVEGLYYDFLRFWDFKNCLLLCTKLFIQSGYQKLILSAGPEIHTGLSKVVIAYNDFSNIHVKI